MPSAVAPVATLGNQPSRGSFVALLPYIEQDNVFKAYRPNAWWGDSANQAAVNAKIPVFLCPAVPGDRLVKGFSASALDGGAAAQPNATGTPADYFLQAGWTDLSQTPISRKGIAPLGKAVRMNAITDGLSNTLCFYECGGGPEVWRAGKSAGVIGPSDSWVWASQHLRTLTSFSPDGATLYGTCAVNCANAAVAPNAQPGAGIYGFHTGGANVSMADGSVQFVRSSANPLVIASLVSIADGEVVSVNDY
ncbi:MAG: DUF1559 domain-containing protein [Planctomycetes bacterium]|nr:DUF1559 domain-containing protein [Planctomycetota bacterium]